MHFRMKNTLKNNHNHTFNKQKKTANDIMKFQDRGWHALSNAFHYTHQLKKKKKTISITSSITVTTRRFIMSPS